MTIIKAVNKTLVFSVEGMQNSLQKLVKRFVDDPENLKKRFIELHSHDDTFIVDLLLAFQLEP